MEKGIIIDLAVLVQDTKHCPICKRELVETEAVYKLPQGYREQLVSAQVLNCPYCKQYFGTWKIINIIRAKYRIGGQKRGSYFPCHIFHNTDPNKNETGKKFTVIENKKGKQNMSTSSGKGPKRISHYERTANMPKKTEAVMPSAPHELTVADQIYNTIPVKNIHLELYCKKVCPTRIKFHRCPFCENELNQRYTYAVGISDDLCVKSEGNICNQCDIFFNTDCELFTELENIKIARSNYTLIKEYSCRYDTKKYRDLLYSKESACRQYTICRPGEYRTYTIVTDMGDRDPSNNIFHYTEDISLKIMTAYILGDFKWQLDGQEFFFAEERIRNDAAQDRLPYISAQTPVSIQKKSNGGLFDINRDLVLLDAVAFFPCQGMLIPVRVTYDRKNGIYFIDGRLLENYADKYGLMICRYVSSNSRGWANLRDESLLHQLGYNVGQSDGLTSAYRHKILSQVMEAGILKPAQIITLLKGLIGRNGSVLGNELARRKWEEDLNFVYNYGVKTKGFVFGAFRDL